MSLLGTLPHLRRQVLEVRDIPALAKAKRWTRRPVLDDAALDVFENLEDLNDRRRLDAEVIAGIAANRDLKTILEIGTAEGRSTALLARNAPNAVVHTVNIPPEEISQGGTLVTSGFTRERIGWYYRQQNCGNVRQIWANTATWEPDIGPIDMAFIDGCHDTEFVFGDTRKILPHTHPGTVLLWHDFNLELIEKYEWIYATCRGVECLYEQGLLDGRILHVRDSWMGYYVVTK